MYIHVHIHNVARQDQVGGSHTDVWVNGEDLFGIKIYYSWNYILTN